VRSPPPDAAESLRKALERNLDWIKDHIPALAASAAASPRVQEYIDWIYERLKDRLPPDPDPNELDRLVRAEVRKLFLGRKSRQPRLVQSVEDIGNLEDQSARDFERAVETADEVRAFLDNLPEEARAIVIEAYTLTEGDLASPGLRERMAKNLGISRNALDQRLSRAIKQMREWARKRPGPKSS
jgi:DNA-directed RNA polymerase specialized sigma24 family protein